MNFPVVLDTDTFNEVDDQFALAHLLLHSDTVDLAAVHAAPFFIEGRSSSPADGMEKSLEEIHRLLDLMAPARLPRVCRGSTSYLPGPHSPVESEAASDLIERALAAPEKLVVLAIGACTNVASALLLEPRIAQKLQVVWLGGHAPYWPHTREFNLQQDLHAARILLAARAPFVMIPCFPVTSHLITTVAELEKELEPYSRLGEYLTRIVRQYGEGLPAWSKVVWDIAASAWLINPEWMGVEKAPSPILRDDLTWQFPTPLTRPTIEIVTCLDRDAIFADFFARAAGKSQNEDQAS